MMMFGLKLSSLLSRSSLVSWSLRAWISGLPPHLGRSWRADAVKTLPETSTSLHFFIRTPVAQVKECLRLSGLKGVYAVLKTEERRTDTAYAVVWLVLPLRELRVSAASLKTSMGLVRINKASKISRGIRLLMIFMNPTSSWSPQQSQHTSVLKLWPSCHLPLWVQPSNLSPGNQPHLLGLLAWQMDKQQTDDMVQNMWFHPPVGGI